MRPLAAETESVLDLVEDCLDNLPKACQPSPNALGPRLLTVSLGRSHHGRSVESLPSFPSSLAFKPSVAQVRGRELLFAPFREVKVRRRHRSHALKTGLRLTPKEEEDFRQRLVFGARRSQAPSGDD